MKDELLEQIKKLYNIRELQPDEINKIGDRFDALDGKTKSVFIAALEAYTHHFVENKSTALTAIEDKERIHLASPYTLTVINSAISILKQHNINAQLIPLLRKIQLDVITEEEKLIRKAIIRGRNSHKEQTPGFTSLLKSKIRLARMENEIKTAQELEEIERTLADSKIELEQGIISRDDLQDITITEQRRKSYIFAKRALREAKASQEELENGLNRTNISPSEQRQNERWKEIHTRVQLAEQEVISSKTWLLFSEGKIAQQEAIRQIGQAENRKQQIMEQRQERGEVYTRK